jgi:hypothetical protein
VREQGPGRRTDAPTDYACRRKRHCGQRVVAGDLHRPPRRERALALAPARPQHVVSCFDDVGADDAVPCEIRQGAQRAPSVGQQPHLHIFGSTRHDQPAGDDMRRRERGDDVDVADVSPSAHHHGAGVGALCRPGMEEPGPPAVGRAIRWHAVRQDDDQSITRCHLLEPIPPVPASERLANPGRPQDRCPFDRHDDVGNRHPGGRGHPPRDGAGAHEARHQILWSTFRGQPNPGARVAVTLLPVRGSPLPDPGRREAWRTDDDPIHAVRQVLQAPRPIGSRTGRCQPLGRGANRVHGGAGDGCSVLGLEHDARQARGLGHVRSRRCHGLQQRERGDRCPRRAHETGFYLPPGILSLLPRRSLLSTRRP